MNKFISLQISKKKKSENGKTISEYIVKRGE